MAFGGYYLNYSLLVLGRAVFGIGSETLYVCTGVFVTNFFHDAELSFAYGINYGFPSVVGFIAGYTNYGSY
jgi:MFS family permease